MAVRLWPDGQHRHRQAVRGSAARHDCRTSGRQAAGTRPRDGSGVAVRRAVRSSASGAVGSGSGAAHAPVSLTPAAAARSAYRPRRFCTPAARTGAGVASTAHPLPRSLAPRALALAPDFIPDTRARVRARPCARGRARAGRAPCSLPCASHARALLASVPDFMPGARVRLRSRPCPRSCLREACGCGHRCGCVLGVGTGLPTLARSPRAQDFRAWARLPDRLRPCNTRAPRGVIQPRLGWAGRSGRT